MVYNAEEMIGDDNEQMVAIGMVEEEGDESEQVRKTDRAWHIGCDSCLKQNFLSIL